MASAFISYVRDSSQLVDRLVNDLRRGGVTVWLDRDSITPGEPWAGAIQKAILSGGFFLACFSREYHSRQQTYMNEELAVAYQTAVRKGFETPWLIPVALNLCDVPDHRISTQQTLRSLQCVNLAADWHEGMRQLLNLLEPSRSFGQLRRVSRVLPTPPRSDAPAPLLALDFGTSFSSMSIFTEDRGWQAIPDESGRTLVPSVVTFADNWDYFVGWDAVAAAVHSPGRSVANIKRGLGDNTDFHVEHKRFDPETLASLVIRFMKENAEHQMGKPVARALVAVPANFSNAQSAALARSCERAGLQVQRLISEPNAAGLVALEWWQRQGKPHVALILVIDMGGGTTDVSLIAVGDDEMVEVRLVAGDNELGGMDYDEALFRFVRARDVAPKVAAGVPWTTLDDRRLMQETSRAKVQLGFAHSVTLIVGEIEQASGLQLLQSELTRDDLQSAVQSLDSRLETLIAHSLALAKKHKHLSAPSELAAVFLAGQGAKIHTVAQLLSRMFPNIQLVTDFQEQAVVRGLGVYSGVLSGINKNVVLIDVLHRSISLQCSDPDPKEREWDVVISSNPIDNVHAKELLHAQDPIPCSKVYKFPWHDKKPVTLHFLEGDSLDRHESLASISVEPREWDSSLRLEIEADVDKTVQVSVLSSSGMVLAKQQLTNEFLWVKQLDRRMAALSKYVQNQPGTESP